MGAPAWLTGIFAALMLAVAVYCAGRLIAARRWRRPTAVDTDAGHVVMGVAMAGMLVASLRVLPAVSWEPVFGVGAVWFASQALRARRGSLTSPWRCAHPAPHLVECAAMLFMFLVLPALPAQSAGAGMAAMSASGPASRFSFLTLILALFMFGYVVRVTDRLTVHAPALAVQPAGPVSPVSPVSLVSPAPGPAADARSADTAAAARHERPYLAPRCAALCKIAMGVTMGYMLILTL